MSRPPTPPTPPTIPPGLDTVPDADVAAALIRAAETDDSMHVFHVIVGLASVEQVRRIGPTVRDALGMTPEDVDGPWLTIAAAAERAGVSDQTIRRAMRSGLPYTERPHGRPRYRLRAADVDQYFAPRQH